MKKTNLAIFIPHYGCLFQCSFCNQNTISGAEKPPTPADVEQTLAEQQPHLAEKDMIAEIAFFGGSFTAIDKRYLVALLEIAQRFCTEFPKQFCGIRCSTRPDCIDDDVLAILKSYGVTAIELGAQSMDDEVLRMNNRGHTADDVRKASALIKQYGFSLGLQMMTGLYGATLDSDYNTGKLLAELKPDTMRIYPTVVLEKTRLAKLYKSGEYQSHTLAQTVDLCAELLKLFEENEIKVIRLGLHASDMVSENRVGGVYHPALRELCESKLYLNKITAEIVKLGGDTFEIITKKSLMSKIIGQKRANILALEGMGFRVKVSEYSESHSENLDNNDFLIRRI